MEYAEEIEAVVAVGDVNLVHREGRWHVDPLPDSPDWGDRERAQRQATARMLEMRANDLPSIGYHPDLALGHAEQMRDSLGATIIYVRPAAEDDEMDEDIVY